MIYPDNYIQLAEDLMIVLCVYSFSCEGGIFPFWKAQGFNSFYLAKNSKSWTDEVVT